MNKKEQIQFAYRTSILLGSGISLGEALSIITRMEKSKKKFNFLNEINTSVEKGTLLSKSILLAHVKIDPTLLSMITYGESVGILELSLRQAAEILEKRNELQKKMIGVLVYPSFIALATIAMTLFLVMYIFPKILPLLSSMNIALPILTRMVRKLYEILSSYGIWLGLIIISLTLTFYFTFKRNYKFRFMMQNILISLPVIGDILKKYHISSACRGAGTLLECGQILPSVLEQSSNSSSFEPYKRAWNISRMEVLKGQNLCEVLSSLKTLFPSIVPDMLSIGERTGSLHQMLHHVSRMYEQELDNFIKYLSSVLEPILMIIMGLIVGSVALSIILPIYEITNHLGK